MTSCKQKVSRLALYLSSIGISLVASGSSYKQLLAGLQQQYEALPDDQRKLARLTGRHLIKTLGSIRAALTSLPYTIVLQEQKLIRHLLHPKPNPNIEMRFSPSSADAGLFSLRLALPAEWETAIPSAPGPLANGPTRFGRGSMIAPRSMFTRALSNRDIGISGMSVGVLLRQVSQKKSAFTLSHLVNFQLLQLKQENIYDCVPTGSLDVCESSRAWKATQITPIRRKSDSICGCTGNTVQPHLCASWLETPSRCVCYCITNHQPPRIDRSRRASAISIADHARSAVTLNMSVDRLYNEVIASNTALRNSSPSIAAQNNRSKPSILTHGTCSCSALQTYRNLKGLRNGRS